MQTFQDLGIQKEWIAKLADLQIDTPTFIQEKTIPVILQQKEDVVALAQTGSGKTLAFGLPILQNIEVEETQLQTLILAPTRELGLQITQNLQEISEHTDLKILSLLGGNPIKPQIQALSENVHIVVATPGRLLDIIEKEAIDLTSIKYLVLDEADEMIAQFQEGLETIIKKLPKKRRSFLFSATMNGNVKNLVHNYMAKEIVEIQSEDNIVVNQDIEHQYVVVEPIEKLEVLMHFLNSKPGARGIIFCKTKAAVNKLAKNLAIHKFSSGALHGSLSQGIRDRVMLQFKEGNLQILVATDLAARGLDVKDVAFVVHYHLPEVYETYVHRSGRTARAGAKGFALTILQQEEQVEIKDFEEELQIKFVEYQKPTSKSLEENNTIIWAKRIFKTKPNHEVSESVKAEIKNIFHHLSKEELTEKVLANYLLENQKETPKPSKKKKKK